MDRQQRANARFRRLINELGDEEGRSRGWIQRVADRLDVSHGTVQKWNAGERGNVGGEVLAKAIEKLKLDPSYFYGAAEPRSYRDFQGKARPTTVERELEVSSEHREAVLLAKARMADWTEEEERWAMGLSFGFAPDADTIEYLLRKRRAGAPADDRTGSAKDRAARKGYRSRKG